MKTLQSLKNIKIKPKKSRKNKLCEVILKISKEREKWAFKKMLKYEPLNYEERRNKIQEKYQSKRSASIYFEVGKKPMDSQIFDKSPNVNRESDKDETDEYKVVNGGSMLR